MTHINMRKKELKIAVNPYPLGEVDGRWIGEGRVGQEKGLGGGRTMDGM